MQSRKHLIPFPVVWSADGPVPPVDVPPIFPRPVEIIIAVLNKSTHGCIEVATKC